MAKRGKVTQLHGSHIANGYILLVAAASDEDQVVWTNKTGHSVNIIEAGFAPDTAVAGVATNNMILQFQSRLAAGGASKNITAIKAYASGVAIVQFAYDALVVSTTAADVLVLDGESIILAKTENGTGAVLPAGQASLVYEFA